MRALVPTLIKPELFCTPSKGHVETAELDSQAFLKLANLLRSGNLEAALQKCEGLGIEAQELSNPPFVSATNHGLVARIGTLTRALKGKDAHETLDVDLPKFIEHLERIRFGQSKDSLPELEFATSELVHTLIQGENYSISRKLLKHLHLDQGIIQSYSESALRRQIQEISPGGIWRALAGLNVAEPPRSELPELLQVILKRFRIPNLRTLFLERFVDSLYIWYLAKQNWLPTLDRRDLAACQKLGISSIEGEHLKRNEFDLKLARELVSHSTLEVKEATFKLLFENLIRHVPFRHDARKENHAFRRFAEHFSYEEAFSCYEVLRHGLCSESKSMRVMIELQRISGLDPKTFLDNIWRQVEEDSSTYKSKELEVSAASHFITIAEKLIGNLPEILQRVNTTLSTHPIVGSYASQYSTVADVFQSWPKLRTFYLLNELTEGHPGLDQVSGELKKYLTELAQVTQPAEVDALLRFASDPESFLDTIDPYFSRLALSYRTSAMLQTHLLDLSAQELRDSVFSGVIDSRQLLPPATSRYLMLKDGSIFCSAQEALSYALGSRSKNIPGFAKNPPTLYKLVSAQLSSYGLDVNGYLASTPIIDPNSTRGFNEVDLQIIDILGTPNIGFSSKLSFLIARMHLKSAPESALAGLRTDTCSPFGSGKNTAYTYNPHYANFTVSTINSAGEMNTIAWSLCTLATAWPKEMATQLRMANKRGTWANSGTILLVDNIEANPKYRTSKWPLAYRQVYQDFFCRYLAANRQLITSKFIACGDPDHPQAFERKLGFPTSRPDLVPMSMVPRLDYGERRVYRIPITKELPASTFGMDPFTQSFERSVPLSKNFVYLDDRMTQYAAWFSADMSDYHPLMQNLILSSALNNIMKDRPMLRIALADDINGEGMIIAYEGRAKMGEKEIPLINLAALHAEDNPDYTIRKLLTELFRLLNVHYYSKGIMLPIVMPVTNPQTADFISPIFAQALATQNLVLVGVDNIDSDNKIFFVQKDASRKAAVNRDPLLHAV